MAQKGKEIQRRLQSIRNTKKITKTMEMVSAAKMHRSIQAVLASRPYLSHLQKLILRLQERLVLPEAHPLRHFLHPLPEPSHTTFVILTTNRGLCGAFHSNLMTAILPEVITLEDSKRTVIAIGKKAVQTFTRLGISVEMAFEKDDSARNDQSILTLSDDIYTRFVQEKTNRVLIAFSHFASAVSQVPTVQQLYPLSKTTFENSESHEPSATFDAIIEPHADQVLDFLLPRYGEALLYHALLESNAAEHSARRMAMKNATDAAGDMMTELTLEFNKARQAGITKEIAEIAAGTDALR